MIPTRQQVIEKINDYKKNHLNDPVAIKSYIGNWLKDINCPTETMVAGQTVNPQQQILDDLISYPEFNA